MDARLKAIETLNFLDKENLISDMLRDIYITKITNEELAGTEKQKSKMISIVICHSDLSSISMVNLCIIWRVANRKDWSDIDHLILKHLSSLKSKKK